MVKKCKKLEINGNNEKKISIYRSATYVPPKYLLSPKYKNNIIIFYKVEKKLYEMAYFIYENKKNIFCKLF